MSSKQLAKYVVALETQTAKYQKGLEDARRKLGRFEKRQSFSLNKIATGFKVVAVAAAAVGAAFLKMGRDGVALGDQAAKTSSKLGLTVNALEGLRFAAQQTGVAQGQLDIALQRVTRRIAEAAQGGGTASKALKQLGLDAKELSRQSPDENMKALADAFENVGSESERVRLAFQLFDSGGVGLVNTLKGGREALEAYERQARKFGLTLTATQVKNVERATDAQGRLSSAFRGLRLQLGGALAPAFEAFADTVANLTARFTAIIPKITAFAAQLFNIRRDAERLTLAEISAELDQLNPKIAKAAENYANLFSAPDSPGRSRMMERQLQDLDALSQRQEELIKRRDQLLRDGDDQVAGTGMPSGESAGGKAPKLGINLSESAQEAIRELEAARRNADRVFARTRTDIENYVSAIQDAQSLLLRGLIDQDTFERWVAVHAESFEKIKEDADQTYDRISAFAEEAAGNMQSAFADFLFDPFKDGLDGMLKNFTTMLRRMVAEVLAQQILTGLFGGLAGSGNSFLSGIGKAFGGPRATGGPVSSGKSYLVGERGPEMFVPGMSGGIVPNHAMGGANITINAPGADEGTINRIREIVRAELIPQAVASATANTIGIIGRPSFA